MVVSLFIWNNFPWMLFHAWSKAGENKLTAFLTALVFVVLAEMGDKTQFATIALAAQFNSIIPVCGWERQLV